MLKIDVLTLELWRLKPEGRRSKKARKRRVMWHMQITPVSASRAETRAWEGVQTG